MSLKRILKRATLVALIGIIIAAGIAFYLYFKPHRDVQSAKVDYSLSSTQIVNEYLNDYETANKKYLSADGNSKILEVTGIIAKISEDFTGKKVILLKEKGEKAGVSATFSAEVNSAVLNLAPGMTITVKGVIRSGASYDEDLELYEHVILDKCDIVSN